MRKSLFLFALLFSGISFCSGQNIPEQDTLVYEDDKEWLAEVNQIVTILDDIDRVSDTQVTCGKEDDMVTTHGFAIKDKCDQQYYIPFHAISSVSEMDNYVYIEANNGMYTDYKYPFLRYKGAMKYKFYSLVLYMESASARAKLSESLRSLSLMAYEKKSKSNNEDTGLDFDY